MKFVNNAMRMMIEIGTPRSHKIPARSMALLLFVEL
jgi:hypothetical protein